MPEHKVVTFPGTEKGVEFSTPRICDSGGKAELFVWSKVPKSYLAIHSNTHTSLTDIHLYFLSEKVWNTVLFPKRNIYSPLRK